LYAKEKKLEQLKIMVLKLLSKEPKKEKTASKETVYAMKNKMQKIRKGIQFLFLLIFFTLIILEKNKIWMGIVLLFLIGSFFFGRFYCEWVCPINTIITPIDKIKRKLGFKNKEIKAFFKNELLRYSLFILFIIGFVFKIMLMKQGKNFPLPLIIIGLGLFATIIFDARTWHRYLCPWGMLFSLTARFSRMQIKKTNKCINCKKCEKICPGVAIDENLNIDKKNCLLCFECSDSCPVKAIKYEKSK
jgi:polyferredoxin